MVNVEIIAVGNELLLGQVQDTNTAYLCRLARGMGGRVRHAALVADEIPAIAAAIHAARGRGAGLIFTCGGLGPTDDDLTLAAVAAAAGLPLRLDPAARDIVARKFAELAAAGHVATAELSEARLKMARLPAGAQAIENPVGAAPAAALRWGEGLIVSLPGVPRELHAIVEGPLQPLLQEVFGGGSYGEVELIADCGDESALAPALRRAAAAHPEVYVKSRASHFGPDVTFRIVLSASGATVEEVEDQLRRASDDLRQALQEAGFASRFT